MNTVPVHPCTLCKLPRRDPDTGAFCTEECGVYKSYEKVFMEAVMPNVLKVRNLMKGET